MLIPKWDAIVFDLDGTLADTLKDIAKAADQALKKNGYPQHKPDQYRIMVGDGLRKLIERAAGETDAVTVKRIMADFVHFYDRDCLRYTKAYEGMLETLAKIKDSGIKLLVVTNKPDEQAQKITAHLYGADFFEGVYGNREGRKTKPDPALTLEALASAGASPSRSLFVGDSDVDILTAANAGMKSAGVTWGFRGKNELVRAGADYIIDQPCELYLE